MVDGNNGGAPQRPTVVITLGPNGPEVSAPTDIILALGMLEVAKALIGQRLQASSGPVPKIVVAPPTPGLRG